MKLTLGLLVCLSVIIVVGFGFGIFDNQLLEQPRLGSNNSTPFSTPQPTESPIPLSHIIPPQLHVFQSFNNCGPATLSMALSYVGISKSQAELGQILRPYQVVGGDNDDKSVTLSEVAKHAESYGMHSYLRPNGDVEKLKKLVANDIVVVARTWLKTNEDIGHYRVIRGYDDSSQQIIQDDSLQGNNLGYSYAEFNTLWQPFNYEYLIIVNDSKRLLAEKILGEDLNEQTAWQNALAKIDQEMVTQSDNWHLILAKSRIYYYLGDYQQSVAEFNKIESRLSFRTLWYQIEPILAIAKTADYQRVFQMTDNILNNQNRAFAELYQLRGEIYQRQSQTDAANAEFAAATLYNKNLSRNMSLF